MINMSFITDLHVSTAKLSGGILTQWKAGKYSDAFKKAIGIRLAVITFLFVQCIASPFLGITLLGRVKESLACSKDYFKTIPKVIAVALALFVGGLLTSVFATLALEPCYHYFGMHTHLKK